MLHVVLGSGPAEQHGHLAHVAPPRPPRAVGSRVVVGQVVLVEDGVARGRASPRTHSTARSRVGTRDDVGAPPCAAPRRSAASVRAADDDHGGGRDVRRRAGERLVLRALPRPELDHAGRHDDAPPVDGQAAPSSSSAALAPAGFALNVSSTTRTPGRRARDGEPVRRRVRRAGCARRARAGRDAERDARARARTRGSWAGRRGSGS